MKSGLKIGRTLYLLNLLFLSANPEGIMLHFCYLLGF
jgi:hypothetical protein